MLQARLAAREAASSLQESKTPVQLRGEYVKTAQKAGFWETRISRVLTSPQLANRKKNRSRTLVTLGSPAWPRGAGASCKNPRYSRGVCYTALISREAIFPPEIVFKYSTFFSSLTMEVHQDLPSPGEKTKTRSPSCIVVTAVSAGHTTKNALDKLTTRKEIHEESIRVLYSY